jgi:hypothetical protein
MTQPAAEPTPLMAFVLAILTTLIAPTLLDRRLARLAAEEAIAAYQPTSGTELIAISQIVAFALSALDTLRLSMPEDVSLSMKLKLRGNANAANRAVRDSTDHLTQSRRPAATPDPVPAKPEPPTPPARHLTGQDWANGMQAVAAKLRAEPSPAGHKTDKLWINALTGVANEIAHAPQRPGCGKAALLRSTWMASDPGIPSDLQRGHKPAAD